MLEQRNDNSQLDIEDFYDFEEDDNVSPGPGEYLGQNEKSSFKTLHKPQYLQFFGSGVERFKTEKENLKQYLGPGYYNNEKPTLRNVRRIKFKTAAFDLD